ncbi:MAG TPA: hypothetical protein VGK30_05125 [Candidatus Binatia bacterium]|jgi:hypothetical protein
MTPLEERALLELHAPAQPTGGRIDCCRRCWTLWLRVRLLEHLQGETYWRELDRGDFGVLRTEVHRDGALLHEIARLVGNGLENIEIIGWSLEHGRPQDDVLAILILLDVNARRVPRFAWLGAATPRCRRLEASEGRC